MNETPETTIAAAPAADAVAATSATTATTTTASTTQPADAPAQQPEAQPSPWGAFMMPLLLIAIFYFMFLKPQQRKEKERRRMIEQLRAGAKVVFAGGIVGTIVEANEKTFVVETRDGSQMEILRSCVHGVADAEGNVDVMPGVKAENVRAGFRELTGGK